MKILIGLAAALLLSAAFAAVPASANQLSLVDHPDVPNCTVFGPNAANCETVDPQFHVTTHFGCADFYIDGDGNKVCCVHKS